MRPAVKASLINVLAFSAASALALLVRLILPNRWYGELASAMTWLICGGWISLQTYKITCPVCQTLVLQNGNWRTLITFRKACSKCGGPI